jgi:hypothetical protein
VAPALLGFHVCRIEIGSDVAEVECAGTLELTGKGLKPSSADAPG